MPCTHEASLFHSFYSQSIIVSLYSLVYSPATSSQLPHSPPRVASKNLTLRRVSLSLSLPFRSSVVATRGRPCSVRRKRVNGICRIYLYDFRFFRLLLQSPIPRDTNDEWPGFSRLTSSKSLPRSFAAFFLTSVVALRRRASKWSTRGTTRSN